MGSNIARKLENAKLLKRKEIMEEVFKTTPTVDALDLYKSEVIREMRQRRKEELEELKNVK